MFGLGEVVVSLAFVALLYFLIKSKNRFLRMCVAGAGCFGGLALVVNGGSSEWIVIGVLVGGIGLATLLRIMSQLIADEINNATGAPEEPG
jgi:hypothetical protein